MNIHDHIEKAEKLLRENAPPASQSMGEVAAAQIAQAHALVAIAKSLEETEYGVGLADTIRRVGEMY